MTTMQQFCLRWNNHQPNFISVFSSLLNSESLVDVTLAAEGRHLQAHKVVLSACSSYFQSLFTINPCQHPIVILKDVKFIDLKVMVDFMYYGEVNVSQEQLPHILKTAEMLKIKGLAEMPDATSLTKSQSSSTERAELLTPGDSNWSSDVQRRSLSPSCPLSPSMRRKRLRQSSTGSGSGSTERITEEHQNEQILTSPGGSVIGHIKADPGFPSECTTPLRTIKQHSSDSEPLKDSSQESVEPNTPHQITLQIPQQSELNLAAQNIETSPVDLAGPSNSSLSQPPSVPGLQWAFMDHACHPRLALPSHANMSLSPDVQYSLANDSLPSSSTTSAEIQTTQTSSASYSSMCPPSPCPPSQSVIHNNNRLQIPAPVATKRKRSLNPQADENFVKALDAVRFGGIGFCKAARMFGVNNRTLWLEYKKRGYPISRLSIKSRVKVEASIDQHSQPPHPQQHSPSQSHRTHDTQPQQDNIPVSVANTNNHVNICQPSHSVAMISTSFPSDFAPNFARPYQDPMMGPQSSHIAVPCTVNFSQI